MQPLPNEVIFVSGQRGSGKSYWTKQLARSLPRCVIFDPLGEYNADHRFYDIGPFVDFLAEDEKRPRLFTAAFSPVDPVEDFETFCRAILARGNLYLIMEELDTVSSPYYTTRCRNITALHVPGNALCDILTSGTQRFKILAIYNRGDGKHAARTARLPFHRCRLFGQAG